jgi:hypothetical protein
MGYVLAIGAVIGIGGTVAMDLWALVLRRVYGLPLPNWAMVGRWVGHLPERVFHDDIGAAKPVTNELSLGWLFHYAVGAIYGVIFVMIMGAGWLVDPSFVPVWIFGLVTIAAGWFLLQPGLGLGWAAAKTATPWQARGMGLVAHTVFATGMWVTTLVVA